MIRKICHLADLHLRKSVSRNVEYQQVFDNLIISLNENKPERIVIVGDLVHENLNLQPEQLILVHNLLNRLAEVAPVRITRGNHDFQKSNSKRTDSVEAIVKTLNNPNIIYYDKTGFYYDDNVVWAVWHHGEKDNNPWKTKEGKKILQDKDLNKTYIDLFHDPINGCVSTTGFEMKSKSYYKLSDFKSDYLFAGDIHEQQFLNKEKTKAYVGSTISQDVTEGDNKFHGYILWNILDKTVQEIPVYNEYSFKNVTITPFTDFDDLDYDIPNPTKYMKIRFIWCTLPQTRNKENERKLTEYFKTKYGNTTISHKNQYIESEKIEVNENITLENISNSAVQHEIFKEYLEKIGTDKQLIDDLIALDVEISSDLNIDEISNIEWNIIKFGGTNFMSYEKFDIDWRDLDGLFQICGKNTAGKTTILKSISYILFGDTLETETRQKYGDSRFVNNRNGATFCDGYIVIEANGEYFGIKKRTEILKSKDGSTSGAPTTLSYYLLADPDDQMNDDNSLEKLDEDKRVKTQQKLNSIIGSYDNFKRIVLTTSDTLNNILSNNISTFIDALLNDSGLDIFDKKLEGLKIYQKKANEKNRVIADVEKLGIHNVLMNDEITTLRTEVADIETIKLPDLQNRIQTGKTYIETLTKKLYKIDPEIYGLKVDVVKADIGDHNKIIIEIQAREAVLNTSIKSLKSSYDNVKLNELIVKRDEHKTKEYKKNLTVKSYEQVIRDEEHKIEIINGQIYTLKTNGLECKNQISGLKTSRTCPSCGQELTEKHQIHINELIQKIEDEMFKYAADIKTKENVDKKIHIDKIAEQKVLIQELKDEINADTEAMELILTEIGILTNDKNDVDRRAVLQTELEQIPMKIQNEELKISILQQKIDSYDNSLLQIQENLKIENGIGLAKTKVNNLEIEEQELREDLYLRKTSIGDKLAKIKANDELILLFKEQEYRDSVMTLYKKCVHRDGIPRQILSTYIIPKINLTLENILSVAEFKIWLDVDDLRPKLAYNNRPASIIDCISSSGKERTFSSIVLKFALNQINVKAKPMMFLLDEVMGKLDENSVEEFIEILQLIKNNMKKVLIIEHSHQLNPDYLIDVQLDENGISSLTIE